MVGTQKISTDCVTVKAQLFLCLKSKTMETASEDSLKLSGHPQMLAPLLMTVAP